MTRWVVALGVALAAAVAITMTSHGADAAPPIPPVVDVAPAAPAPEPPRLDVAATAPRNDASSSPGAIRGRIVASDRTPIAAATVELLGDSGATTSAAADGAFALPNTLAGPHTLHASAPGFAPVQLTDVVTTDADDVDVGDLVLPRATPCRGRVFSQGLAVAGAEVVFEPVVAEGVAASPLVQRVHTDDAGRFLCDQAPPPPMVVRVIAAGYRTAGRRIENAAPELLFDLERLPVVRGRVLDAVSGVGIDGARVVAFATSSSEHAATLLETRTRGDGAFEFAMPFPRYGLRGHADDYLDRVAEPFDATNAVVHAIVMTRSAHAALRVTWNGKPLRAGLVTLSPGAGSPTDQAACALVANGDARLPDVAPGRWHVRIAADGPAIHEQWLDLSAPGEHRFTIAMPAGARLVGTCHDGFAAGREVVCVHPDGRTLVARVGRDGTFAVPGLHAGSWTASIRDSLDEASRSACTLRLALREATVDVAKPGGDVRLDLTAAHAHFATLVVHAPTLPPGTRFELVARDETQRLVPSTARMADRTTEPDCCIGPTLPGTWRLEFRAPGSPAKTLAVVLGRGINELHLP